MRMGSISWHLTGFQVTLKNFSKSKNRRNKLCKLNSVLWPIPYMSLEIHETWNPPILKYFSWLCTVWGHSEAIITVLSVRKVFINGERSMRDGGQCADDSFNSWKIDLVRKLVVDAQWMTDRTYWAGVKRCFQLRSSWAVNRLTTEYGDAIDGERY